jgi:Uma2 family endonuclease
MVIREKLTTADELWEACGEAQHLELVKGVPVQMTPTGTVHGALSLWLGHLILVYVDEHDLGLVTAAETGFILAQNPDTVRAPDIGFVVKDRLTEPVPERYFPGAPDLAVEIVFPGDTASDIHDKVMDYLQAGTRLVWIVYPRSRTVAVYQAGAAGLILDSGGTLDGGDVLPGLSLPVRDIFKKLRE